MADPRFARRAVASLRRHDDWLRQRNPRAADALLTEIERLCGLIAEFPELGRRIDGTSLRYHVSRSYRYRVIYRISGEGVEILDILHPRQA